MSDDEPQRCPGHECEPGRTWIEAHKDEPAGRELVLPPCSLRDAIDIALSALREKERREVEEQPCTDLTPCCESRLRVKAVTIANPCSCRCHAAQRTGMRSRRSRLDTLDPESVSVCPVCRQVGGWHAEPCTVTVCRPRSPL